MLARRREGGLPLGTRALAAVEENVMTRYDLIIVGGGVGGSALATAASNIARSAVRALWSSQCILPPCFTALCGGGPGWARPLTGGKAASCSLSPGEGAEALAFPVWH